MKNKASLSKKKEKVMKAEDKITSKLMSKGYKNIACFWEPIIYSGREGREGGWNININPDEAYGKLIDFCDSNESTVYQNNVLGAIMTTPEVMLGYNVKSVLELISRMPSQS